MYIIRELSAIWEEEVEGKKVKIHPFPHYSYNWGEPERAPHKQYSTA